MPRAAPAERYDPAHQAWAILVEAAERPDQRTITYGELAGERILAYPWRTHTIGPEDFAPAQP